MTRRNVPTLDDAKVEREKLETLLWEQTEWRGTAPGIAALLTAIDAYADVRAVAYGHVEPDVLFAMRATPKDETAPLGEALCMACETVQPLGEFRQDRSRPLGRRTRCKRCVKEKRYIGAGETP